ncbi:MAG: PAS domain-containing protein [Rhodospirillales bacterium]|nr:PAS domain-containing protein [Rhodospirillales bacterium]
MPAQAAPERASTLWRRPHVAISFGGAILAMLMGGILALDLLRSWRQTFATMEKTVADYSFLVEQHVSRTFQTIELSADSIGDMLAVAPRLRGEPEELRRLLGEKLAGLSYVRSMVVTDASGAPLASAPDNIALSMSERDFFRSRRDSSDIGLRIHRAVVSKVTNTVFIPVTWRLEHADRSFAGIVFAAVDPEMIAALYQAIDLGANGSMTVGRTDGTIVARVPQIEAAYERTASGTRLFRELLPRAPTGTYTAVSSIDGRERVFGYRLIDFYGVVVLVGMDTERAREAWFGRAKVDLAAVGVFILAIGIATALLVRAVREREATLQRALASEDRFRDYAEIASDWLYEMDARYRFTYISPRRQSAIGPAVEPRLGRTPFELATPEELAAEGGAYEQFRRMLDAREAFRDFEFWSPDGKGGLRCVAISGRPVFAPDGTFEGYRGTGSDLTQQKETERTAVADRTRLEDAIESMVDGFAQFDSRDRLVLWNTAFARLYEKLPGFVVVGRKFEDFARTAVSHIVFPDPLGEDGASWLPERLRRHRSPSGPLEFELKAGGWGRIIETRTRDGGTVYLRTDITELKDRQRNAERLAQQQQTLAELSQSATNARDPRAIAELAVKAVGTCFDVPLIEVLYLNQAAATLDLLAGHGWPPDAAKRHRIPATADNQAGYTLSQAGPVAVVDQAAEQRFGATEALRSLGAVGGVTVAIPGSPGPFGVIGIHVRQSRAFSAAETGFLEQVAYVVSAAIEHWAATRERQLHEARLAGILNALPANVALVDRHGVVVEVNRRWASQPPSDALFGPAFASGTNYLDACRAVRGPLADAADALANGLAAVLAGRASITPPLEYACTLADRRSWYRTLVCALSSDPAEGAVVMHIDVSDRRQTEETLAQSQKLEAIGQLTGGIAHDFNNLLTVILGQSDLLAADLAHSAEQREMAETINAAARRGAELTRQLLAFARRQSLQPARINLHALIEGLLPILRRALGATIEIRAIASPEPLPCLADQAQLEAAVLNLAINARDAMGKSGVLTIETSSAVLDEHYVASHPDATPGAYAVISVTDTGHGMTQEVIAQAFEPFFTTKPVGQGTGLGLSMVYGFVRQSGGHAKIYSEVGRGTTVKLYLPRTDSADPIAAAQDAGVEARAREGETILLVEDDLMVRSFAVLQLKRLGYRVLDAENGPTALALLQRHDDIDLVFSDVVMPGGMTGQDLAREARRLRPGLLVLLTSGYPAGALAGNGDDDEAFELIGKPYHIDQLARRLRALLDRA